MEIGDKVICVNNNNGRFALTIGKEYEIVDVSPLENMFGVINDDKEIRSYLDQRFLTVFEYRIKQINKLKEKIHGIQ